MTIIIVPFRNYIRSKLKCMLDLRFIAKRRRLYFSSYDEFGRNVLAIDSRKAKLIYLRNTPLASSCLIIDLRDLQSYSVRKEYRSINAGELKTGKLYQYLKAVFLQLVFKSTPAAVQLLLYDERFNQTEDMEQLDSKIRKWETIVSKHKPVKLVQ